MNSIVPAIPMGQMESSSATFAPASAGERAQWLDALRGFALVGILIANILPFSGYAFRGLLPPVHHAWAALDPMLEFLEHALIEAKFYSLFSFLFGLGFALQLRRAERGGVEAVPMLRRRMTWLLVFGLAHAVLIWFGDILSVYALFGFALLWFRNMSQRALLTCALAFLASPMLVYLFYLAIGMGDPLGSAHGQPPSESLIAKLVNGVATGSYIDVVQSHTVFYGGGWVRRAVKLALPRIFGMFLLGVWAARIGLPYARDAYRPLLKRVLICGMVIGLPLNLAYAALGSGDALLPASAKGLLVIVLASIGIPLLCLAYAAAFALYWRRERPGSLLVTAGRVPLSHYLGQSVVCVTLFYGFGFGLFGQVSYGVALLIGAAVYLSLTLLARAWLRSHANGPMETLWRRLSYGPRGDVAQARS